MDLQSLKEFPSSAVGYFVALLVGALTSFLVTKWAMAREEKGRLINAAEGIKSAADRIVTIEKMIVQQQALVETIEL